MIKVGKLFIYNQNVVLWGLSALALGLYTYIKLFNLKMSSILKLLDQFSPICSKGSALLNKMATMPIYGKKKKTLKNLLWNQENLEAESWYIAYGTQGLLSLFKLPFLPFYGMVKFLS